MREDVAREPLVDSSADAAAYAVSAHSGAEEVHPLGWKAGDRVQLDPLVIEVLLRDAVAIKDDRVAVFQVKARRASGFCRVRRETAQGDFQNQRKACALHV